MLYLHESTVMGYYNIVGAYVYMDTFTFFIIKYTYIADTCTYSKRDGKKEKPLKITYF